MTASWTSSNCYCHGLAGDGDYLLDLTQMNNDRQAYSWASEIVEMLWAPRIYVQDNPLLADETGQALTGGYGAGLTGCLAFLNRFKDGGTRLFHLSPGNI